MTNLSLFNISMEFKGLSDLMEDEFNAETGELIDKSEEINQLYSDLKLTFEEKLNNSQRYCLLLDSEADVLDKEIKRLQAKKKAIANKKDRLKTMMLSALQASGEKKIKTDLYTFNTRKSKSVYIKDESVLQRKYLKISYSPDKVKIGEELKNGVAVDGAVIVEKESLGVR